MTNEPPAPLQTDRDLEENAGGDVRLRQAEESISGIEERSDEEASVDDLPQMPQHPLLLAAHQLFEHGDNRAAMEALARIPEHAPEDVRAGRDALQARIRPDRFTLVMAAACVVLGLVVAYLAIST